MDQNHGDKKKINEKYIITDMTIFAISATMVLLLALHCLKTYADSRSGLLNYFLEKVEKIEKKISNRIDRSIFAIKLYEEKITNITKDKKKKNQSLDSEEFIKIIFSVIDDSKFIFIPSKQYIFFKEDYLNSISIDLKKELINEDYYILIHENNILVCKNIFVNKKLIGTIACKPFRDSFDDLMKIMDIADLEIIDHDGHIYKAIEEKFQNYNINEIYNSNNNYSNITGAWLDLLTGENLAFRKIKKYSLVIKLQMNQKFVKKRVYSDFISKFLEILVFGSFFLFLIILIIRKDKIRNEYTEKLKEDAINANKAKSDFLAYTAHEIRSPLGFIITGTEMIKAELFGSISKQCKEYIDGINFNAKFILDFITEILDENRILQKQFYLDRKFHDVTNIINDVVDHNKTTFHSKKISIFTDFEKNLPFLYCDNRKLYQIINNLVTNSCKYSKDEVVINIKVFTDIKKLFINIKDNGMGMDQKEINKPIKKHESINSKYSTDSYGLGLSIVKLLVEAHEGQFSLNSKKNVGTSATISFDNRFLKNNMEDA